MAIPRTLRFMAVALFLLLTGTPERAEARPACTTSYLLCLNWALQQGSPTLELGSIECGAGWVGCVARKLRFW